MDQAFNEAVEVVLKNEGGYVRDPDDPGGETKFGISKKSYPDLDIAELTRDEAVAIYHRDFWEANRYGEIHNFDVAMKVFDLAVNVGAKTVNVMLQLAIGLTGDQAVEVDGIVGPQTLGAVNGHSNAGWLVDKLRIIAVEHYAAINNPKYLAGWIKRSIS